MAKVIKLKKILSEKDIEAARSGLAALQSTPSTLMSLLDQLKDDIRSARQAGVSWDDIAEFVAKLTDTDISSVAVSTSYLSLVREEKNEGRGDNDLSYTQLKYRYRVALQLLKKLGKSEEDIENIINRERRKRKKDQHSDEQTTENKSVVGEQSTEDEIIIDEQHTENKTVIGKKQTEKNDTDKSAEHVEINEQTNSEKQEDRSAQDQATDKTQQGSAQDVTKNSQSNNSAEKAQEDASSPTKTSTKTTTENSQTGTATEQPPTKTTSTTKTKRKNAQSDSTTTKTAKVTTRKKQKDEDVLTTSKSQEEKFLDEPQEGVTFDESWMEYDPAHPLSPPDNP